MSKTLNSLLILCLVQIAGTSQVKGIIDLSGEWTMDREKTALQDAGIFLAAITIEQKKDSLLTSRTYENEYGEQYPFDEPLMLDGKEHKITIYEMPRTTTAQWSEDGNSILITSIVIYYGDSGEVEFQTSEKWYLAEKGALLCNEYSSKSSRGEQTGTLFYKKK